MTSSKYRYVALLRALNVGGHAIIKMTELKKLFESFGFDDVVTHIQSGNVVFSTKQADPQALKRLIEKKLKSRFEYPITVFVFSSEDLKKAASRNPFEPERLEAEQLCHLMFLSDVPDAAHRKALMALAGDEYRFHIQDRVLYFAYAREAAGSRRNINIEKVLGVTGTARSWKVVAKLIELSAVKH